MERTVNFNVSTRFSEIVNEFRNEGETTVIYAEDTNLKAGSDAANTKVARAKELVNTSLRREFGYTKNCTNAISHITNMTNVTAQGLIDAHEIASAPEAKIEKPEKTPTSSRAEKSSSGSKSEAKVIKEIAKEYGPDATMTAMTGDEYLEQGLESVSNLAKDELLSKCSKLMYDEEIASMFENEENFITIFKKRQDVFMCETCLSRLDEKLQFQLACHSWLINHANPDKRPAYQTLNPARLETALRYIDGSETTPKNETPNPRDVLIKICERASGLGCGDAEALRQCIHDLNSLNESDADSDDKLKTISKAVQEQLSPAKQNIILTDESDSRKPKARKPGIHIPLFKFVTARKQKPLVLETHPLFPALNIASEKQKAEALKEYLRVQKGNKKYLRVQKKEKVATQRAEPKLKIPPRNPAGASSARSPASRTQSLALHKKPPASRTKSSAPSTKGEPSAKSPHSSSPPVTSRIVASKLPQQAQQLSGADEAEFKAIVAEPGVLVDLAGQTTWTTPPKRSSESEKSAENKDRGPSPEKPGEPPKA